jgi:hypothetical protein
VNIHDARPPSIRHEPNHYYHRRLWEYRYERGAAMSETTPRRRASVALTVRVLVVGEALVFLIAALVHLGIHIPVGVMVLAEPRIVPATIVEGLCGFVFAGSAYGVFTRRQWAWTATTAAHIVALAGVLLGMVALAVGAGPHTAANALYHRVMLVVLGGGLLLLVTPISQAALGHSNWAS